MSGKPMRQCYEASLMVKFLSNLDDAETFLRGAMLAKRLRHFKDMENDPARWDPNDGLRVYRHISGKPAPASDHFSHVGSFSAGGLDVAGMAISYTTEEDPYVICLSRFVSENVDPASCLNQLAQQVREAGQMGAKFGAYAVVIERYSGEYISRQGAPSSQEARLHGLLRSGHLPDRQNGKRTTGRVLQIRSLRARERVPDRSDGR